MRDFYIIGAVCLIAVGIGTILFFFGPASLQSDVSNIVASKGSAGTSFTILAQGTDAHSADDRTNYKITSTEQLQQLWTMIYGIEPPAVPSIDFSKYQVLALFDGSHATDGYSIQAARIDDQNGTRTIRIVHSSPGSSCKTSSGFTSPYAVIQVPISSNTLAHVDVETITECP